MASLSSQNLDFVGPEMSRLRPYFAAHGAIQLMGCEVGAGTQGPMLLKALAMSVAVPVTAGVPLQLGGGDETWRFEGKTVTAFPFGTSLKGWARAVT